MPVRRLMDSGRRPFPTPRIKPRITGDFPPWKMGRRPYARDPTPSEASDLAKLRGFALRQGHLSASSKLNLDMDNAISLELARQASKAPAYAPRVAPQLWDAACPVSPHDHTAAARRRRGNNKQA